ncbi:MAG TPA: hypothetical protein VKU94_06720 [Geobacterales bacterium]|nr:hypothetical protein [Geobacterales bacterium]
MKLIIVNFRLGGKRSYPSQVILQPEEKVNDSLLGKIVEYRDKHGNIYKGRIMRKHGRNGFIAVFKPNIPPSALGGRALLKD